MLFLDTALSFDPARRRCDLTFNGTDFALDNTPVTPVLTAVGLDRRAHSDDMLPDRAPDSYTPAALNTRRGYPGDALDLAGDLTGSRIWLIHYGKQTEATRLLAEDALREVLEPLANARNWPVSVLVEWVRAGVLGWRITVAEALLNMNTAVAR